MTSIGNLANVFCDANANLSDFGGFGVEIVSCDSQLDRGHAGVGNQCSAPRIVKLQHKGLKCKGEFVFQRIERGAFTSSGSA